MYSCLAMVGAYTWACWWNVCSFLPIRIYSTLFESYLGRGFRLRERVWRRIVLLFDQRWYVSHSSIFIRNVWHMGVVIEYETSQKGRSFTNIWWQRGRGLPGVSVISLTMVSFTYYVSKFFGHCYPSPSPPSAFVSIKRTPKLRQHLPDTASFGPNIKLKFQVFRG